MIYALILFLPNGEVELVYKNSCMLRKVNDLCINSIYVKKSFDLVFILSKVDWVVTSPCSTEIVAPVRETKENDATWATKERDFESQKDVL
jgi:hypothetical protein